MIPIWQPRYVRRRKYKILVRPTRQGEFLLFPFGWRRGGRGVLLSLSLKEELEQPQWDIVDSGLLGAVMLCFGLGFMVGPEMLVVMAGVLAGWGLYDARRYQQRLEQVAARGRVAPYQMTFDHYQMEYASQVSKGEITALLGIGGLVGLVAAVAVFAALVAGDAGVLVGALGVLPCAAVAVWRGYTLAQQRQKAFRLSVVAGDAVDVALPVEAGEGQTGIGVGG